MDAFENIDDVMQEPAANNQDGSTPIGGKLQRSSAANHAFIGSNAGGQNVNNSTSSSNRGGGKWPQNKRGNGRGRGRGSSFGHNNRNFAQMTDEKHLSLEEKIENAVIKANLIRMPQLRTFASSISDPPDGTLIVGTYKIPIHKMYLSYYSEYFKTMFRSEFIEGRQDEIVLEEVGYLDMLELLSVIYPSNAPITDKNIIFILKLADRFIMPAVLDQCKNMLRTSSLNGAQKLFLAQQYNFKDLQKELAQQCKTLADAKKLKSEPEYKLLDSDTHSLILDSITS